MSACKSSVFGALLLGCLAAPVAAAAGLDLQINLASDASAELQVLIDAHPVCSISKKAGVEAQQAACRYELPPTAQTLTVRGMFETPGEWFGRNARRGERSVRLLDFGPVAALLSAGEQPIGERVMAFRAAAERFAKAHLKEPVYSLIETGSPAEPAVIDAAGKRLGFALPADFVALQRACGALQMGENSLMALGDIDNAYAQMQHVWGSDEDSIQEAYSEKFRDMLKASTLLFTEVGDGYGGLLYRPGTTKACGNGGTYYWTSQEGGTSVLKNADGSCMDFAAAWRWLVNGFLIEDLSSAVDESSSSATLLIDSSLGTQLIYLSFDSDGEAFQPAFSARWPGPNQ